MLAITCVVITCVDGKVLDFITSHKDLGVLVDLKLHFHDHICYVCKKGRRVSK